MDFGFGEIVGAHPRQKNGEDASVIHPGPFSAPFFKMKSLGFSLVTSCYIPIFFGWIQTCLAKSWSPRSAGTTEKAGLRRGGFFWASW